MIRFSLFRIVIFSLFVLKYNVGIGSLKISHLQKTKVLLYIFVLLVYCFLDNMQV